MTRFIGFPVSVPVRPAAERKRLSSRRHECRPPRRRRRCRYLGLAQASPFLIGGMQPLISNSLPGSGAGLIRCARPLTKLLAVPMSLSGQSRVPSGTLGATKRSALTAAAASALPQRPSGRAGCRRESRPGRQRQRTGAHGGWAATKRATTGARTGHTSRSTTR
jgi:hypothetical protein